MTDCLFCRMVAGEIPADVVLQTDRVFAFRDINPQAPTHVLVIPKEHHADRGGAGGRRCRPARRGRRPARTPWRCRRAWSPTAASEPGYRLVTNTGPQAGQSVYHVHFHVLGGRRMEWPPG